MKKFILLILLFFSFFQGKTQQAYQPSEANLEAREDFQDRRFGMFIHWGIYSILGDGEWVMHQKKIPYADYSQLASFFYPYAFQAKEWVKTAKAAGMKYITITSRHHDGFSMFGTEASDYNIVNATIWGKDPMKSLAEECHKQGLKLFFYYSLLDWGREDYAFGSKITDGKPVDGDWEHYIEFMKKQLTELLTKYGEIGGIWFDGEWERPDADWHFEEIYGLIHKLQPAALIINNHHHAPRPGEDVQEFEKDLPGGNSHGWNEGGVSTELPLESCETMNNSWGFKITDHAYKSVKTIVHYLVKDAGANANLLLNVGPMPNGKIQKQFSDTLLSVGAWIQKYGNTIYETRAGFYPPQDWGVTTQKKGKHYLHLLNFPEGGILFIKNVKKQIKSAVLYDSKEAVDFKQIPEGVFFYVQDLDKDQIDTVIQIEFEQKEINIPPKSRWVM